MATNYPGALDSLTNPGAGDALNSPSHSAQHANANDAIEAVETELGVNPSGSDATVAARLSAIEAGTNLATGAVTSAKIADGTIATADIADGAVTYAKLGADVRIGNLLTLNQASLATTGVLTLNSCTEGAAGVYTASGSGAAFGYVPGPPFIAVTAGDTHTALATLATVGRTANVRVEWLNSGGSIVSFVSGSTVAAGTTAVSSVSAVAPAGAVAARFYPFITGSGSAGNTVTVTKASFHSGAGGVWQPPGAPVPGQSRIAVNNAVDLSGTGSPEGVVTAAPGSTWLQTDATTDVKGWIRWIKATGTGNTGWVAGAEADTGWRNVLASLTNSWAGWASDPQARIRRIGNTVFFEGHLKGDGASNNSLLDLPAGWRPASGMRVMLAATDASAFKFAEANGNVDTVASSSRDALLFVSGSWMVRTSEAWPSSLPGSAA